MHLRLFLLLILAFNRLLANDNENFCKIIGGTTNYTNQKYDISVKSFDELKSAANSDKKNICIPSDVVIEIPNNKNQITLKDGVTLGTCDYKNGMQRGTILVKKIDSAKESYSIILTGDNVKIINLEIIGPNIKDGKFSDNSSATNISDEYTIGIQTLQRKSNLEVANSIINGWPGAGISIKSSTNNKIHHNIIVNNMRYERGYGIVVQNGNATADVFCNIFKNNRHSIAGSGLDGEGYKAKYNLQFDVSHNNTRHAFDMHKENNSNSIKGGEYIEIENNWFIFGGGNYGHYPSIYVRGLPTSGLSIIKNNYFKSRLFFEDSSKRYKRAISEDHASTNNEEKNKRDNTLLEDNFFNVAMNIEEKDNKCYLSYKYKDKSPENKILSKQEEINCEHKKY